MKNSIKIFPVLIFLLSCKSEPKTIESAAAPIIENVVMLTDAQFNNAKIETTTLQEKNLASTIKSNGKIDIPVQNIASISVPLGGYLRSTRLIPGLHVSKGDVIAVMEDQQYIQLQQDYLLAKSKLHFAELEYNRQKELNENQASSDKITQQAQSEVNIQRITMNATAEKLRLINKSPTSITAENISKTINIYSSLDGYVSKVKVNIGKYVAPSDVMFELIDPTYLQLNIKVFEKDISKLSIGQRVIAYDNTQPIKKYNCKIVMITKNIAPEGTVDVYCKFDNYDKNIIPGMYMNAEIEATTIASYSLPEESIVTYEGKAFVFVETKKQQFELVEVSLGQSKDGYVSIINSIALNNKIIVTKGAYTLLMKMKNKEE